MANEILTETQTSDLENTAPNGSCLTARICAPRPNPAQTPASQEQECRRSPHYAMGWLHFLNFAGVAQWLESEFSKLVMRVRSPSPAPRIFVDNRR